MAPARAHARVTPQGCSPLDSLGRMRTSMELLHRAVQTSHTVSSPSYRKLREQCNTTLGANSRASGVDRPAYAHNRETTDDWWGTWKLGLDCLPLKDSPARARPVPDFVTNLGPGRWAVLSA
ncbi:hypothetical protein VTK26DRAFT_1069 [Humicola hyalothermophila]